VLPDHFKKAINKLKSKNIVMKTILVPTDFSDAANNAAEYAVHLAKEIKARVLLFNVFHVPIPITTDVPVLIIPSDELQRESEIRLKKQAFHLNKETGIDVACISVMGLAVDEILEQEKSAALIIMGMRGATKLSEALLGSITTAVLRKAKTPVLVIPEKIKYKKPEKIVFACDYNPTTDAHTLDSLKSFLKIFHSKIYVLNVKQKQESVLLEEAIAGVKLEGELRDAEHVYYFSEKENLVDGINEFVEQKHADMVVIIPHRYNLMERLFHKSISKKMAFHTHVPMLSLPDNHESIPAYFI
jgi:nucleotide-binding universal stress UspA family protein